jgi:hypothetical protein
MFVAGRFKGGSWPAHSTEQRAGIVDTMWNDSTKQKPATRAIEPSR